MLKKSININLDGVDYTITHETSAWAGNNIVTINDKPVEGLPKGMKNVVFDIELGEKKAVLITSSTPMDVVIDGISQTSNNQVDVIKATKVPWWTWLFVVASAVLVPTGGAIGAFLGVVSVMFCLSFGRNNKSTIVKVLSCLGVTVSAWLLYFLAVFFIYSL